MANERTPQTDPSHPLIYQIRIQGHLGPHWTGWFEGLTIAALDTGETLLTGPVIDQAALQGLLKKVRDLGLPLVSVTPVTPGQAAVKGHHPGNERPNQSKRGGNA